MAPLDLYKMPLKQPLMAKAFIRRKETAKVRYQLKLK